MSTVRAGDFRHTVTSNQRGKSIINTRHSSERRVIKVQLPTIHSSERSWREERSKDQALNFMDIHQQ